MTRPFSIQYEDEPCCNSVPADAIRNGGDGALCVAVYAGRCLPMRCYPDLGAETTRDLI